MGWKGETISHGSGAEESQWGVGGRGGHFYIQWFGRASLSRECAVCRQCILCKGPEAGPSLVCLSTKATSVTGAESDGERGRGQGQGVGVELMEQDLVSHGEDLGFALSEVGAMQGSGKRRDVA